MTPTELNEGFELEKKVTKGVEVVLGIGENAKSTVVVPTKEDAEFIVFLRNHALELLEAARKVEEMEKGVTVTNEGLGELYCEWFICNSCKNSMISEESNFCPNCGKKIIR